MSGLTAVYQRGDVKCALVKEPARSLGIGLPYLPSYSTNLNLIERVWRFVKKQCLRSTYHATYEAFTGRSTTAWPSWARHTGGK